MADYVPPVSPEIVFNFVTPDYVAPVSPDIIFEMTAEDDGGATAADPRRVQHFVIT
jgi:hypothetical protein